MSDDTPQPVPARDRTAAYAAGLFSLGLVPMMTVAVPLWAIAIGASPFMIGIALGARSALSVPFSIHGGALMDRYGPRRMMIACAVIDAALLPLYPALPWIVPLIALQLVVGFTQGLAWMGAQTRIALMARDDPRIVGRFTFVSTLGNVLGPPVVGAAWDAHGPWGAFALLGLWCAALFVSVLAMRPVPGAAGGGAAKAGLGDVLPRLGDYAAAFRLMAVPAVGFVVTCSFLMTGVYAVRHSFYPVYLEGIGMSGTLIGILFAAGSTVASVCGLAMGAATRRFSPYWLLLLTVAGAALGIGATPWRDDFAGLLALAVFWGASSGVAFPLTLFVLSRLAGAGRQGMIVGVRTTMNRLGGFVTPVVMGAIAGATDLATSYLAVCGAILACLGLLGLWLGRRGAPRDTGPAAPG